MVAKKMMKQAHKLTLLLQLLLLLISLAFIQVSYGNEINLLLSFKASIKDPTHALSSWNNSTQLCDWIGVTCSPTKTHVQGINLSSNNISGEISSSLFRLSRVESIDLSSNELNGEIHVGAFSCLSLRTLNVSNNNLTGQVPSPVLGSRLESLDLSNNMLSGSIPRNLGWLLFLRYLDLGGNAFTGPIPRSVSNLTSLEYLTLASNQLIGEIPRELGNLKRLKWIYLGYNRLSGRIPNEIGMLNSLYHLDLVYNNLSGPIPTSFGNLKSLQYLFLYQNNLNGTIPPSIATLKTLISLDLSDNLLNGEIPQNLTLLQNLQVFHLFSNKLTGEIPNSITLLPKLQVLQLWSNNLHGKIPQNLGKFNNLTILDLSTNSLIGKIPNYLCNSRTLSKLILFSNSLEGEIPSTLGECHSLERIRLQNNSLLGELPKGFTKLENVNFLDLSRNNLSGKIGHDSWNMLSLQMLNLGKNNFVGKLPDLASSVKLENLDLSENQFSGNIPPSYGNLVELMDLQLGRNQISGIIPKELCSCTKVVTLNLSHNKLSGPIPYGLGQMPVLGQLDISDNQLSGMIPRNLGSMDSLVEVNVSYNHLHGVLPPNGAFLAINLSDVAGNNLCDGDHLGNGLPPCQGVAKGPTTSTAMWWGLGASLGVAIMVVVGFVMCMLSYVKKRSTHLLPHVQRVENEDGIWDVQFFDLKSSKLLSNKIHDIISIKNNKIMKINDNVDNFVVEEISVNNNIWEEILELGKIRHGNIMKILGACKSEKSGILIYEKVEGSKCLSEVIHGLSWGSRRKIVLGIARALKFLHYSCSPSLLVGEMSPEKVVVGGDDSEARLKLGVGGLFCLGPKSFLSSAYVAPETKEAKEITDKNDIYGFGLILIELLTGKGPMDSELGSHGGVVEWARYCYSDCHLDTWIDPMIKDQRLSYQNEIVETMNMALQCTSNDPIARPSSSDLVKNLECSFARTRNCVLSMEIS